ncbi:MAG: hypothetical protein KDA24_20575, partial [Deltaproteobacteria bacterium]|nr:hypothetical protein [Deltaproteobacteria bacterium]
MSAQTRDAVLAAIALGVMGALAALPLHLWAHRAAPGWEAGALGFAGAAVPPLLLASVWRDLPPFLRRPLDAAVAVAGVLLVA